MKFNRLQFVFLLAAAFVLGALGAFASVKYFQPMMLQNSSNSLVVSPNHSEETKGDVQNIRLAYDLIKQHYFEEVDENELVEGAIQGMLETLEDPYSSYMNEDAMERFNEQIESSFQGIGAEVSMIDGKVTVVAPIKDSPAEKAGLRPNDQILEVDDEPLEGLDLNEAVERIRGEKGSEVVLLIQRQGTSEPFTVQVVRDDIPVITVESELYEEDGKKTGYIDIRTFSETTEKEFIDALTELEGKNIDGLILDVRGNPGGLLTSIEEILQHFIPKNIPYLQTEDRTGHREKFYTMLEEKKPYPINVIIDEGSASASEILAVAMKEVGYDIIGETSFGKGTVQQAVPLSDQQAGSTIKLTFYKWLSPKGNWIHEKGVEPTVKQSQPDFYYASPIIIEETLRFDDTDEQIKHAQLLLKELGYDPEREDGYFDRETEEQIKSFQDQVGLAATGELDEETAFAIETEIMDRIHSGDYDLQLKKALEVLYK